jgi:hypothetical protein
MQYKKRTIIVSQSRISESEARISRQREIVGQLERSQHPADHATALLLVMEQSLLSMRRFLEILERDLERSLGLPGKPHRTKVERRRAAGSKETIAKQVVDLPRDTDITAGCPDGGETESSAPAGTRTPGARLPH